MERILTGYGLLNAPVWEAASGALLFADAARGGAFSLSAGGEVKSLVPHRRGIGGMVAHAAGGVVIAGRNISWRRGDEQCLLADLDPSLGMTRFNDIGTDRSGRLYAGSLELNLADIHGGRLGYLHVIDLDGTARIVDRDVRQANGIAASPQGDLLYLADTLAKCIWRYELGNGGEVSSRSAFIQWASGEPDGIAIASDGAVWVALREEWCIVEVGSDGRERQRIAAPPGKLTALCFGGTDLQTLYVTTGTHSDPESGSIYRCRVDSTGEPVVPCRVPLKPPARAS